MKNRLARLLESGGGTWRLIAVGTVIALITGAAGAVAADLITSKDIKNNTIKRKDLNKKLKQKIDETTLAGPSQQGQQGEQGPPGPPGTAAYVGETWGLIDRNTEGSPVGALRAGPASGTTIAPPLGIGSLGIETKDGTEKVAFGNAVDFAGDPVSGLDQLGYSWFQTGEDYGRYAGNGPNLTFEIDPGLVNGVTPVNYTSFVYVPNAPASPAPEQWITEDADANPGTTGGWWFTNGYTASTTGCTQANFCSLAEAKTALANNQGAGEDPASILTVAIAKGKDYQYQGAADALRINDQVFNFEPFGVSTESP